MKSKKHQIKAVFLNEFTKALGLHLYKTPSTIYFQTRFGIHTVGLGYNIDVLILDKKGVVRKLKEKLAPNRIFLWNVAYFRVIEMPAGTISKKKIDLGDIIETVPIS